MKKVNRIHHISATVKDPQNDVDFFAGVLNLKLVKQTLNYDNQNIYHLYYGNKDASSALYTTFPMKKAVRGILGAGQVLKSTFAMPKGSLAFWENHFKENKIAYTITEKFNQKHLNFFDPSGLYLSFIEKDITNKNQYTNNRVNETNAFIDIDSVSLLSNKPKETLELFTKHFGFEISDEDESHYLLKINNNSIILNKESMPLGRQGIGTVHHLALEVDDIEYFHKLLSELNYKPTEIKRRFYFDALYFKEPGGSIIELSTKGQGMQKDEELEDLGSKFIIPNHFLENKEEIMQKMKTLKLSDKLDIAYPNKSKNQLKLIELIKVQETRRLTENEKEMYNELRLKIIKERSE